MCLEVEEKGDGEDDVPKSISETVSAHGVLQLRFAAGFVPSSNLEFERDTLCSLADFCRSPPHNLAHSCLQAEPCIFHV